MKTNRNFTKPELIAGAGDWSALITALGSGADSAYFGVKGLNMRNLAINFDLLELKKVMQYIHSLGKKGYLALNVIIYNHELTKVKKILKEAALAKVDAIILWDMALLSLTKDFNLSIHLSTQASVSNIEALKFYAAQGVKRIVLARECALKEIKNIIQTIKKEKIPCEIETFIHGAMCISVSGRCFLSQDTFAKSANRGECLQPCRREFTIKDTQDNHKYILGNNYVLSAKDLCTIDFLDQLIESGINAFKIEGRNRSPEYVKVVTAVYRKAIDSYYQEKLTPSLKGKLKKELKTVYNRGFSSGFYFKHPNQDISKKLEATHEKFYVGYIRKVYKKINVAEIVIQQHPIHTNDTLLIMGKTSPAQFAETKELEQNHLPVNSAQKGERVGVKLPFLPKVKDKVFLWKPKA